METKTLKTEQLTTTNAGISVVLRDTGKYGLGIFAAETVCPETKVATLSGERIGYDKCAELIRSGLVRMDDPLQIDSCLWIIVDGIYHYFNHCCDPNVGLRNESDLFALRDISAGEEIRFDYSTTAWPSVPLESDWIMECDCGSSNCRKRIGHVLTVPVNQIVQYLKQEAFPAYMLKEFRQFGAQLIKQ
jgi:uncharacterized protein